MNELWRFLRMNTENYIQPTNHEAANIVFSRFLNHKYIKATKAKKADK